MALQSPVILFYSLTCLQWDIPSLFNARDYFTMAPSDKPMQDDENKREDMEPNHIF